MDSDLRFKGERETFQTRRSARPQEHIPRLSAREALTTIALSSIKSFIVEHSDTLPACRDTENQATSRKIRIGPQKIFISAREGGSDPNSPAHKLPSECVIRVRNRTLEWCRWIVVGS